VDEVDDIIEFDLAINEIIQGDCSYVLIMDAVHNVFFYFYLKYE